MRKNCVCVAYFAEICSLYLSRYRKQFWQVSVSVFNLWLKTRSLSLVSVWVSGICYCGQLLLLRYDAFLACNQKPAYTRCIHQSIVHYRLAASIALAQAFSIAIVDWTANQPPNRLRIVTSREVCKLVELGLFANAKEHSKTNSIGNEVCNTQRHCAKYFAGERNRETAKFVCHYRSHFNGERLSEVVYIAP